MGAQRAVVITGASSGIGRACALALARGGWRVFAGVRKEADAASLLAERVDGIAPLTFDVTRPPTLAAAAAAVEEGLAGARLAGLVNNAGVAVGGPLEFLALDDLRAQLEVNVVGLLAATQAFLPLLRQGRGRVVNISSMSGRVSTPFMGPYCASKHAVEALNDALRGELRPWGMEVISVLPGRIRTPIWDKGQETTARLRAQLPADAARLYGPSLDAMEGVIARNQREAVPVERVTRAVEKALGASRPRLRYVVGPDARAAAALRWLLPERWFQAVYLRALGLPASPPPAGAP